MAKPSHPSDQAFQKPSFDTEDDSDKSNRPNSKIEHVHDPGTRLSAEIRKTPIKESRRFIERVSPMFPILMIDSSNRIWCLNDAASEPVECFGPPLGRTSSFRRHVLMAREPGSPDEHTPEDPSKIWDRLDLGIGEEDGALRADRRSRKSARKKRLSAPVGISPAKKRRSSHFARNKRKTSPANEEDSDEEEFSGITFEKQEVRVCDLRPTMEMIMMKIQQKGLKRVLKAWLSKCHPQKQAKYPYNGGKDQELKKKRGDSDYDNLNPGLLTAPDYWPPQDDWLAEHGHVPTGVRHKEPDHLLKPERIILAMHLVHAGDRYSDAKFNIDKMEESTLNIEKYYPEEFRSDAKTLLESLYYARRKEIEYENNEIDAETSIYVFMPAQPPSRPKRMTRPKKKMTKVEQTTPELGDVFELPTPFNPSPSANSSFTSTFRETVKIESGRTTPLPGAPLTPSNAVFGAAQAKMERVASQTSSGDSCPSTIASEELTAQHSSENTPPPSDGDTEVDSLDIMPEAEQHLELAASQSLTPRPDAHRKDIHSLNAIATTITRPLTTPTFHHGLPEHHRHGQLYSISAAEQEAAVGPVYVNPTDTYMHHIVDNSIALQFRQGYPDSVSNDCPATGNAAPTYTPFPHQEHDNQPMGPPSHPNITAIAGPSLLAGYPSGASSDFNGAMPVDPEWHNVDQSWNYIRDGTYQQQHANAMPAMNTEAQMNQEPDNHKAVGYWATEFDAMAHDPRRFSAVQSPRSMVTTPGTVSVQQQPMRSVGEQQSDAGVAMQQRCAAYGYSSLGPRG